MVRTQKPILTIILVAVFLFTSIANTSPANAQGVEVVNPSTILTLTAGTNVLIDFNNFPAPTDGVSLPVTTTGITWNSFVQGSPWAGIATWNTYIASANTPATVTFARAVIVNSLRVSSTTNNTITLSAAGNPTVNITTTSSTPQTLTTGWTNPITSLTITSTTADNAMDDLRFTTGADPATQTPTVTATPLPTNVSGSISTQFLININSAAHQKFGLYYPVTYMFQIPPGQSNLSAQFRTSSSGAWTNLPTFTSGEIFNGVNAARFDYQNNTAYLSVAFIASSDNLYLRILNGSAEVSLAYLGIPNYYDNRRAAVTVSLDDWNTTANTYFDDALTILSAANIHTSVGVITAQAPDWSLIQQWANSNFVEISSHSRNHPCTEWEYQSRGYTAEVTGSRDDLLNILVLPHEYIPLYIEPCGYNDASVRQAVVAAGYLATRGYSVPPAQNTFSAWGADGSYERAQFTNNDIYYWPWGTTNPSYTAQANAMFDSVYAAGGIYHFVDHPYHLHWFPGSALANHVAYIGNRADIWYAAFGELYLYHYIPDRGAVSVIALDTGPQPPTSTPLPPTATATNTPVPPTATNTPLPPTATDTPVPTPTATNDPGATATNTPLPPTPTNSVTPLPPTATSTNTPVPPTATNTSVPPTATNTPDPSTEFSLWDNSVVPGIPWIFETTPIEVGVKFRSSVDGYITAIRFYKGEGNTGTHIGRLWSATGQMLAEAPFTNETASGWQTIYLNTPVPVLANTLYVASYFSSQGNFAVDRNYFATAYTNSPLTAPSSTDAGGNGVYFYGPNGGFPTSSYQASNYWIDVIFHGSTSLPTATNTPLPPTATNTPLPPTATNTPLPATNTPTAVADLIFADSFESGNLTGWTSSVTNGSDLSAQTSAAMVGSYGLRAVINDNNSIYVTDDTPAAESRYRARFYIDPNSIVMSTTNTHYIFYGYSGTSTVVLRLELGYSSGVYRLRAAFLNDFTTWQTTSWFNINDAPNQIEIDWIASTSSGANNGSLTFWINGVQRAQLTGMNNDTRRIDRVRLGAVAGIDSGTRGAYLFDGFESREQTYIGQ